mgnify:CR=1 FL=1
MLERCRAASPCPPPRYEREEWHSVAGKLHEHRVDVSIINATRWLVQVCVSILAGIRIAQTSVAVDRIPSRTRYAPPAWWHPTAALSDLNSETGVIWPDEHATGTCATKQTRYLKSRAIIILDTT